jgi:hypothetical protein
MTPIPAKVLIVDRLGDQYLITVQVESEKYPFTFDGLNFGENKPYLGSYRNGWLDLAYQQNPGLKAGEPFPLWAICQADNSDEPEDDSLVTQSLLQTSTNPAQRDAQV